MLRPYFIGAGTGIIKEFSSFKEMIIYHAAMQPLDRHFCKLYDCKKHLIADGWNIYKDYYNKSKWRVN